MARFHGRFPLSGRTTSIASIVLVISLAGVAFAATLPINSVGTKQLKKNAVTTAKIAAGAVTGAKIHAGAVATSDLAANAVTGDKVNESTLGKVPSAAAADTADTATTATTATTASSVSSVIPYTIKVTANSVAAFDDANLQANADTVIATNGTLSFVGDCVAVGATVFGWTEVKTSADGATMFADGGSSKLGGDGSAYLNAATLPTTSFVNPSAAAANTANMAPSADWGATGPDGSSLSGVSNAAAKSGTLPVSPGNSYFGAGNVCVFSGFVTKSKIG